MSDRTIFDLEYKNSSKSREVKNEYSTKDIPIKDAIAIVTQQMQIVELRPRTIESYMYVFKRFCEMSNIKKTSDINADAIYQFLSRPLTANGKKTQLKQLKAVLNRFYNNGWFSQKFWADIQIKVDEVNRPVSNKQDIALLLSLINTKEYVGFRDSLAILILYKTGIRIRTLGTLSERNFDFEKEILVLKGEQLKNRNVLYLPIDEQIMNLTRKIIIKNNQIRAINKKQNDYIFLTLQGDGISQDSKTNAISRQLTKYSKRFGIKNINPHAIRRLYAQELLAKGASVALISQALGHASLETTTDYLQMDKEEIAQQLKDFL